MTDTSGLETAIKDMSFNRWTVGPDDDAAAVYMEQRQYWIDYLRGAEPHSVDVFIDSYPARQAAPVYQVEQEVHIPRSTKREDILRTANTIIHGDREQDYGAPIDSFTRLAAAIQLVLDPIAPGIVVTPATAAKVMIAMKLSRLAGGDEKDDTWVDLAGYAALGAEVRDQS